MSADDATIEAVVREVWGSAVEEIGARLSAYVVTDGLIVGVRPRFPRTGPHSFWILLRDEMDDVDALGRAVNGAAGRWWMECGYG